MATSTLSNTILDPSGTALAGVVVRASLRGIVGGFRSSTFTEISTSKTTTTDSAGFWSLTLERQADILPAGSYWEVEEQIPVVSGGVRVWAVTMGAVNSNLYASLLVSLPSGGAGTQYLTEAAGDARYVPILGPAVGMLLGGYAQVTADQTGITSEVDLTGLSVGVTVGAGRRIKITATCKYSSSVTGDRLVGRIKEGASTLTDFLDVYIPAGNATGTVSGIAVLTPTTGTHTYKLTFQRFGGTGTASILAAATYPASILVEDIGGV